MTLKTSDQFQLQILEERLRLILPEPYHDLDEEVAATSMGSAALRFDGDGKVAWDQIWGSFCDLAMAGGPPHRGRLLEAGTINDIQEDPKKYEAVHAEIARGIAMVTGLAVEPASTRGWIRVPCAHAGMVGWLVRAITMENVATRSFGTMLELPVGAHFRLEKEIKNVITVLAKTHHYWTGHIPPTQQRNIANFFARIEGETPLLRPCPADLTVPEELYGRLADAVVRSTGLSALPVEYHGWLGLAAPSAATALWLMRGLIVSNILARCEGTTLFLPIDPENDPEGYRGAGTLAALQRLSK